MKKVIRRNCFETNSSSQHSIVVTKDDKFLTEEEVASDFRWCHRTLHTYSDDTLTYERCPFRVLHTAGDKTWFVIASYCGYKPSKYCKAFIEYLNGVYREVYPKFGGIEVPTRNHRVYLDENGHPLAPEDVNYDSKEVTNPETGKVEDTWYAYYLDGRGDKHVATRTDEYDDFPYYGYVDHQSSGLLQGFLDSHNITIKDFIFNQKYHVVIDGDEYCIFDDMVKYGLIDKNNVSEIYPYHEKYGMVPFDEIADYNELDKLTGDKDSDS